MTLREFFPTTNEGAKLYGGFMYDVWHFVRIFEIKESVEDTINEINQFLTKNEYDTFSVEDLDEEYSVELNGDLVSVSIDPYQENRFLLQVTKDVCAKEVPEFITKQLIQFRDERDWAKFHDSKNLAAAISIEAAELNELFLWKNPPESEKIDAEKLKEELADIIAYSLLLAEKHQLNIESIVLDKILKNAEKYPVEKAKGTSKKYNEL